MPFGKTLEIREFNRLLGYRSPPLPYKTKRDRTLRGRARIKRRKLDNKKEL